jgi:hypothetical protein
MIVTFIKDRSTVIEGQNTSGVTESPRAWPRHPGVAILAVIIALSGCIEVLAVALYSAGSHALVSLLAGFGVLAGLPLLDVELFVAAIGILTVADGLGIWRLTRWGFGLGVALSAIEIVLGVLGHSVASLTSFTFIRGAVVLVVLLRLRGLFLGGRVDGGQLHAEVRRKEPRDGVLRV